MRRLWIATGFIVSLLLGLQVSAAPQQVAEENWSILLDKSAQLSFAEVQAQSSRFQPLRHTMLLGARRLYRGLRRRSSHG